MAITILYNVLNIIAIIAVFYMVMRTFQHLEAIENRALFLALIGLMLDITGQYSLGNADTVEAAGVGLRLYISGRAVFGFAFVLYMVTAFREKGIRVVSSIWAFTIVGAFAHGFFIENDTAYLAHATIIKVYDISVLYGQRGVIYWNNFISTLGISIWGIVIAIKRARQNRGNEDKRERLMMHLYVSVILIHSVALILYEVNYGSIPYFLSLIRVAGTTLYFLVCVKYSFINFDAIANKTIVDDIGIGFMIVSDKYEVLYANEMATRLAETSRRLNNDLSIKDIIDRREYQILRGGTVYRISAERLYTKGKLVGYSVLITDITDIAALERQAERSQRARKELYTNISHELRTPLNAIIGATEMMRQDNASMDDYRKYSEVIREGAITINDLLADILEASEEKEAYTLKEAPFSMATLVNNIVSVCGARVARKKINFSVSFGSDVPLFAKADDKRIRQALSGILINAIRYTNEGSVNLRVGGNYIENGKYEYEFLITDLGNNPFSNDKEIEQRIADGSFVAGTESSSYEIGMTVARRNIQELGGRIASVNLSGRGSIFRVNIPCQIIEKTTLGNYEFSEKISVVVYGDCSDYKTDITSVCSEYNIKLDFINNIQQLRKVQADDDNLRILLFDYDNYSKKILSSEKAKNYLSVALLPLGRPAEAYGKNLQYANKPVSILTLHSVLLQHIDMAYDASEMTERFIAPQAKVLLVDDNSLNVQLTYNMLEQFGIIPDSAEYGMECLDILKNGKKYDLIFMDYMMEGMDGLETTANIRKMSGSIAEVPIIAFTANSVVGAREKYIAGGMNDCIFKPATMKDFEQVLKKYLPAEKLIFETGVRERIPNEPYPNIEGIDAKTAMKYTGGNVNIFTDMLVSFANDIDGRTKLIVEYASSQKWNEFIVQIHGIKGVARTLGMVELSDRMARIEAAAKESNLQYVNSNLTELLSYYRKFNKILMPYVVEKANQKPEYNVSDSVGKILVKIHEALEEFEIEESESLFNTIWPGDYEGEVNSLMRGLKESIDNIDYYASLEYVERLLDTYNK